MEHPELRYDRREAAEIAAYATIGSDGVGKWEWQIDVGVYETPFEWKGRYTETPNLSREEWGRLFREHCDEEIAAMKRLRQAAARAARGMEE